MMTSLLFLQWNEFPAVEDATSAFADNLTNWGCPRRRTSRFRARGIHSTAICLFTTLALLICALPLYAQTSGMGSDPELVAAVNTILDDKAIASGFQGVVIQSLQTGETLYELNADKTFLPASNNKLLTAAVALEKLGKDFVYRTRVYRTGKVDSKGVLHGDLILQGSGDPLLSPNDLKALVRKVKNAGIRKVGGNFEYDASLFDTQELGEGWSWDDETFYYSAQVSALNVNQNMIYVQVVPSKKAGSYASLIIGPQHIAFGAHCIVMTAKSGSKKTLSFERERGHNYLTVKGSIPIGIKPSDNLPIGVTVENPEFFTMTLFSADFLDDRSDLLGSFYYQPPVFPKNAVLVAEHKSASLSWYLKRLNKPSDNLVAECLLKTVGAKVKGKGTANADGTGSTVALEWFKMIGLETTRIRMADGSGLSRVNYVSPRNLVTLLAYMKTRPDFAVFYDSLPIAGIDGTLKNRLKNTAAANNCRAKTGTMMQVCSLSGYVTAKDGEQFAFSILMNNQLAPSSAARAIQDKIVVLLAEHTRSKP